VATGPQDLILRIETGGGFVPPGYILTELPQWALFGDGRIVFPGPVPEISPGPLLPNVREMHVTPEDIQKIVAAADDAGLLGPDASFDAVGIMDAGTTVFTTVVNGKVHRISAYALFESAQTADQPTAATRARLLAFQAKTRSLPDFLGRPLADSPYKPEAMRVFVRQLDSTGVMQPTDQPAVRTVAWPLSGDPLEVGEKTGLPGTVCLALTGSDLSTFLTAAASANAQTIWTQGDKRYSVGVRPTYPNESGCGGSTP
jgi:hypothetical protein